MRALVHGLILAVGLSAAASALPAAQGLERAVYRIGQGVVPPAVIKEVKPKYTEAAKKAKVQGTVVLECIVQPDGTVGDATSAEGRYLDRVRVGMRGDER